MAENKKPKIYRGSNAVKVIENRFDVKLTPVQKRVVELEGYALEPYKDDKGVWTTGVGQTGIYMDMTAPEVLDLKEEEVKDYIPGYNDLPLEQKAELFQIHYRGDLAQSPKFRALWNDGKYEEASVELLNHAEYRQRSRKPFASMRDGVVKRLEQASDILGSYRPPPTSITIPGRERVFPESTEQPPVPSMTPEEQSQTQSQLESLFGETAQPSVEERALTARRALITPAKEPRTMQEAVIKQDEVKPIPYEPHKITRVPYDFGRRLTLEDIQGSQSARDMRAVPGDILHEGKLYRVYSEKPSQAATEDEQAKLSAMQELMYGFDRYGNTIEENVADYLKTIVPLSGVATEQDIYGDVFAKADSDTRRDMLASAKARELIEEYGYETVLSAPSGLAVTGGLIGSLTTPTTLIPLGGSVKSGALLGAALSAGYTASADLAERGELQVMPTAASAILGGVLGGGLAALTRPSNLISSELLLDKNGRLLNSSDMSGRLVKLQREGKVTAEQVKATHDYYTVAKPIAEAEQKIAQQGPIARMMSPIVDRYLGTFNTTLKKYSSLLAQRVRTYEINSHIKIANSLKKATPFIASFNKLTKTTADDVAYRIGLGQFDEAKNLMPVSMQTEFEDVVTVLKDLGAELKKAGHTFDPIENYFPRLVKDYDALSAALGRERSSAIQKQIATYARLTGKAEADLSIETLSDITNKYLRGMVVKPRKGGGATFVKESRGKMGIVRQRELDKILEQQKDLMQYYASPGEAIQNYITKAVTDIEKRRVLGVYGSSAKTRAGKELVEDTEGFLDADSSLGFLIQRERAKGDWSADSEKEIVELLRGYFVGGNQSPGSVVRFLRTAGYAGTIANPISAITQFGDLGMSGAIHGFRNTISAMLGEKNIKLVDNGLKSLAEFEDPKRTGAFLEKLFKYSGFATIDRIGKETTMQAALNKAQQLAQTTAGRETLRKKYGQVFGKEFDNFIGDLQRKEITDNVKYYALNELADVQPVFLSELPRAYIENPNGRVLYMLKSYTLKAYDVVRSQVIQEYAKGNKAEAIKKAGALAAYLSLANAGTGMTKDFLLGRDVKPEQIPDRALWGLLGVFGANQYVSERYLSRGDLTGFAKNLITPATPLLDEAFKLGGDIVGGDLEEDFFKYAKPVPIVGNIAYNWLGGGAEAWNERNK